MFTRWRQWTLIHMARLSRNRPSSAGLLASSWSVHVGVSPRHLCGERLCMIPWMGGLCEAHQRRNYTPPLYPSLADPNNSWLRKKVLSILYAVTGVLSRPAYAIPLLLNVTGSIWFFILIGQAELSLTVPITNSLAFLFTVLGEWWAEKKVISRGETNHRVKQRKADDTQRRGLAWHLCSVVSHYAFKASHRTRAATFTNRDLIDSSPLVSHYCATDPASRILALGAATNSSRHIADHLQ
jgi:hypothetical protein